MNRLLPLEGGRNFRDLGGYQAGNGRKVKWRKLFRSGVMTYLTPQDENTLHGLKIQTMCDLRTAQEREREPTHWSAPHVVRLSWEYDRHLISLRALLNGNEFTAAEAREAMLRLYRMIPDRFTQQFAVVFQKLTAPSLPLVFNCSAGKDRTGVMAALILTSLGVPRPQVIADYELTNTAVDLDRAMFEHPEGSIGLGDEHTLLARASKAERKPLMDACADYLLAAFAQIEQDYGSTEGYLRERLGVSEEALDGIRDSLLERV